MSARETAMIFVPGIRAKPPAEAQLAQLRRCLAAGFARQGAAHAEQLAELLEIVGWSWHFYGAHGDIEPDLPGIEALLRNAGDEAADLAEARNAARRFTAAMYAIGDRFPILSSLFATHRMETRMDEINRYFRNQEGLRDTIGAMLAGRLRAAWAAGRQVIVIGHSFGSVIAWDTCWQLSHEAERRNPAEQVDLFVSMGSPLTMQYVRNRLRGAGRSGPDRYPANIRRWLNFAAIGEVTALDRRMADCFSEMRALDLIESIEDDLDVINRFRGPDGLNVHKCYGYLASDEVARRLLEVLRAA